MRLLPHVPAAGLARLRAVGWAGRRRASGRTEERELWVGRPDGGRVRGVLHPARGSRAAVLAGIRCLEQQGIERVVLLGWSFGGAVVIRAGLHSPSVVAVATVGAQTAGTAGVGRLAPRPLLVLHGTADPILPDRCARDLYARAADPKELGLYPGDGHGLEHHQTDVLDRLTAWTLGALQTAG